MMGVGASTGSGNVSGDIDAKQIQMALAKLQNELQFKANQNDLANLNESLRDELNRKADK